MKLDAYIRVSRVGGREGDSFISPDVQREKIERFATARGFEIARAFTDLDESGGKLSRPGFDEAIARVEAGESGGMVVAKLDRFARSLVGGLQAIERIQAAGGVILSAEGDFDTSTPTGKMVARIMLTLAEFELDRIRDGFRTSQARAVARGVHVASRVPTGYLKGEDGRLQPDPQAAPVIAELFRRRAAGEGWTQLAAFLDASGIRGPYQNALWSQGAAAKIVHNRVYLGEARSGQHVNPDAHEPIVSRAEWEAAQSARPGASIRNGDGLLLAGLVRCAGCRYLVKADHMTDRDGERLGLYRCRVRHAAGKCRSATSALARVLDPWVEEQFLAALGPKGPLAQASASTRELAGALHKVEAAEAELVAYRDESVVSVIGHEAFTEGLVKRQGDLDAARGALAEARDRAGFAQALPAEPFDLVELWPSLTLDERRKLLRAAVDAVVIRAVRGSGRQVPIGERAIILWRGQAPADFPRRGLRTELASFVWPDEGEGEAGVTSRENRKPRMRKRARRARR
jgi:site-specific DNA recombinase